MEFHLTSLCRLTNQRTTAKASAISTPFVPVYRNTYAWFVQFRGDRIARVTAFYDSVAFNDVWRRVTPTA